MSVTERKMEYAEEQYTASKRDVICRHDAELRSKYPQDPTYTYPQMIHRSAILHDDIILAISAWAAVDQSCSESQDQSQVEANNEY